MCSPSTPSTYHIALDLLFSHLPTYKRKKLSSFFLRTLFLIIREVCIIEIDQGLSTQLSGDGAGDAPSLWTRQPKLREPPAFLSLASLPLGLVHILPGLPRPARASRGCRRQDSPLAALSPLSGGRVPGPAGVEAREGSTHTTWT